MKWDLDQIKAAAQGRWEDILIAAGIPAEVLDGRHHPCPKCGGTDRCRFIDKDAGAMFCSQCFSSKNGDGIAAIQWWRNCTFQEAIAFVAEFLGIKPKQSRKSSDKPLNEAVAKVSDISEDIASLFGGINPGINLLGLQRMGAIYARKGSQYVVAFPCFGDDLATLVNYVCMAAFDKTLVQFDKDGNAVGRIRKSTAAKGAGLLGEASLAHLRADQSADICWKCEGPTDLAALLGAIPDEKFGEHVAVSNTHGAGETPGWQAEALARAKAVYIVHDRDAAGRAGAIKWAREICSAGGKVRIVELPEDGQDLRDFIQGSGEAAYSRLLTIAEATEWFELEAEDQPASSNGAGPILRDETKSILAKLGIDVLGENDRGHVKVYSIGCKKSVTIKNLARATRADFAQYCGYSALNCIADPGQPATKGKFAISDVREAVAVAASKQVIAEENDLQGPGLWANEGQVVLCNKHHLSVWDGSTFVRLESSRAAGMLFELGRFDWYDHGEIEALLPKAKDPKWCESVWEMLSNLIGRWHWQRQKNDPVLLAGLVGATICQSVWQWRPQVAVTGETNSGKTSLLRFLFDDDGSEGRGVIGKLAFRSVGSSPAGIRQRIGRASRAIVMDEFDSQRSRGASEFMKWLRAAGPGEPINLGTTNHLGISFTLRNIVWLAGIHVGLNESADANRFLVFDQTAGTPERRAAWKEPTKADRDYLRPALVAIAVVHCLEASRVAHDVAGVVKVPKVDARRIRCMAAPAALMAVSAGGGRQMAEDLVRMWAAERALDESQEVEATHDHVLREALSMTVEKGGGQKVTVGEIIFEPDYVDSEYRKQLEAQLKIAVKWKDDRRFLAINGSMIGKKMEKMTGEITQVLQRHNGAVVKRTRIAGASLMATWIPWDVIEETYQGSE